ncbi:peptidase T [Flavihumibacter profundi]|uniref:peptidase T n=1 Tax=Flavihumibacter profundi TaxID=2716883 RepID=UPI001CC41CF1|nr:peptidase T [Flavihumibacter profundi]MBZ5857231.1 peptidase T [Flavihumibacter profundi]
MINTYQYTVEDRFLRYVQVDTQSDFFSDSFPSTEKQKDLGLMLVEELKAIGLADAEMDQFGYVYATIPANSEKEIPTICFCSHMDTSPDVSGTGVKPLIHRNYDGGDIVLPDDPSQVITMADHPYLKEKIGEDIVTASGTTLLGADDKAGVAVIMDLANFLVTHPELKHGKIRILFTPDEEVGRGVNKLDMKKLGADIGYTLDAGEAGSLEEENFSADGMTLHFHGVAAHPGAAKGKMVNAIKIAAAFLESLPKEKLAPEFTEGREGFVHPVNLQGSAEKATLQFIIRDFDTIKLGEYEYMLQHLGDEIVKKFPGSSFSWEVKEQYRNMKEVVQHFPKLVAYAEEAISRAGGTVRKLPIRGGTDGARLSFMGLPCPNLFTGEMALHSKHEFVSVQDMQRSVNTLVELVQLWEKGE